MVRLRKWLRPVALSWLALAALSLDSAFAWLSAADSADYQLAVPQYRFEISAVNVFTPPTASIRAGEAIANQVGAVNNGDLSGFVRLLIWPTVVAADGLTALPARIGQEIKLDLNTVAWREGEDDDHLGGDDDEDDRYYYYYLDRLDPGQTTTSLFTRVTLSAGLDERYSGSSLKIEVKAEAVEAKGWHYRLSWWGSEHAPSLPKLLLIDQRLSLLAQ
ncbi:MAG: hypothetical protein LBK42_04845 [Propionibacteriaceae bacterium]|jgi:hypothetical protein|nr:hypothetical protein [Propionibacteriaceae bacterium]